jgi:hypothetical protein
LVYSNPADVHSSDRIRTAGEATADAGEKTLRSSIGSIHTATLRTGSGGVAWIDENDRDAHPRRLVGNFLPQLMETPGMVLSPLAFTNRCPFPDALQILQGHPATGGVFRPLHQFLRDPMVFLSGKALFFLPALFLPLRLCDMLRFMQSALWGSD